MVAEFEE